MPEPRVLIVDDEALARRRLRRLLEARTEKYLIDEAANGIEAAAKIAARAPDLIFLDIEMPGLSGLDLLSNLKERPFKIIFQTAFNDYALRAFEEEAVDYLLKPFSPERFGAALERALSSIASEKRLSRLEAELRREAGALTKILVRSGRKTSLLDRTQVACFISRDHYTLVYDGAGAEHISEVSLDRLEQGLTDSTFVRTHRKSLVNLAFVEHALLNSSEGSVELKNGMSVEVARRSRAALKKALAALG